MADLFCPKCGASSVPSATSCTFCGSVLMEAPPVRPPSSAFPVSPEGSWNTADPVSDCLPSQGTCHALEKRSPLRNVASRQRVFLFALLCLILANLCRIGVNASMVQQQTEVAHGERKNVEVSPVFALGFIGIGLFQLASVALAIFAMFTLARSLQYTTLTSILLSFLMLIPLLSLIVMLIVNSQATKKLSLAGYKVGLFGINPNLIRD